MFAPRIARAYTKTAEGPNSKLLHKRSAFFGGTEPHGLTEEEAEADPASLTAQAAKPGVSWDFSKITVFPPDRTNHDTSIPQKQTATPAPADQTSRDRAADGS